MPLNLVKDMAEAWKFENSLGNFASFERSKEYGKV
jgi:hypothetical protein